MTHELRMVMPEELVIHANFNRPLEPDHIYSLMQHMSREGFREDRAIEVGELLDSPGFHLISGHHRVAAAFFTAWHRLGGTGFQEATETRLNEEFADSLPAKLPFFEIPARVVPLADLDDLLLKMSAAHRESQPTTNSNLALPLSSHQRQMIVGQSLKFPDIFRKSNRALATYHNMSPHVVARLRQDVVAQVARYQSAPTSSEHLWSLGYTPERLQALAALIESGERTVTRTRDGKTQEYVQKPAEKLADTRDYVALRSAFLERADLLKRTFEGPACNLFLDATRPKGVYWRWLELVVNRCGSRWSHWKRLTQSPERWEGSPIPESVAEEMLNIAVHTQAEITAAVPLPKHEKALADVLAALEAEAEEPSSVSSPFDAPPPADLPATEGLVADKVVSLDIGGSTWEISIELSNDPAIGDWLSVSDEPWTENVKRVQIRMSLAHPFMLQYSGVDVAQIEPLQRVAVAIALAEITARESGVRMAGTFRRTINNLLREALSKP